MVSFRSDRSWRFAVSSAELWDCLTITEDYPNWWPWLRRFRPDGGFRTGARWSCTVSPPLPYDVQFSVLLDEVDPARRVRARVDGDVRGDAVLSICGDRGGCTARLQSSLTPAHPVLRSFGTVARPVVRWGHDWVLDQGQRQFVAQGLSAETS